MATLFPIQLAEAGNGEVIAIVVAVLVGAARLIWWLADSKGKERRAARKERRQETGEAEKEEAPERYVADETEVRRFLETLGVQAQPPRPPEAPRRAPPGPPPRPPQRTLQVEPEPLELTAAPSAPQPPPRPQARPASKPAPTPEPAEAYTFGSPSAKPDHPEHAQTSAAHRHVAEAKKVSARKVVTAEDRLAFPHLPPLQRAIILSDILGRRPGARGRARL